MIYSVYKIFNLVNPKIYVGRTSLSIKTRLSAHLSVRCDVNKNQLYKDIEIFGKDKFFIETIEQSFDQKESVEREFYWINTLNTLVPNGYNIKIQSTSGLPPTVPGDDPRLKIRQFLIDNGRMHLWLANKIDVDPTHLSRILWGKRMLPEQLLDKINEALQTDFKL